VAWTAVESAAWVAADALAAQPAAWVAVEPGLLLRLLFGLLLMPLLLGAAAGLLDSLCGELGFCGRSKIAGEWNSDVFCSSKAGRLELESWAN